MNGYGAVVRQIPVWMSLGYEERVLEHPAIEMDQQDVRQSLEGDEHAFARLVNRHETLIFRQMWRFTQDRAVLEELVQEVFVEAYLSLRSYKSRAPFLHWLRRIATRVGYRHWKQLARQKKRLEAAQSWYNALDGSVEPAPSEAERCLRGLLEQLPPKDRLVLTLFYFEELDTREIADRTGWSHALVRVQMHRARQKLRNRMREAGFGR